MRVVEGWKTESHIKSLHHLHKLFFLLLFIFLSFSLSLSLLLSFIRFIMGFWFCLNVFIVIHMNNGNDFILRTATRETERVENWENRKDSYKREWDVNPSNLLGNLKDFYAHRFVWHLYLFTLCACAVHRESIISTQESWTA